MQPFHLTGEAGLHDLPCVPVEEPGPRRIGRPDDGAGTAVTPCSRAGAAATRAAVPVDGGRAVAL